MLKLGKTLYTNHLGERFVFGEETGTFIGDSELFSYKRSYSGTAGSVYDTLSVEPKDISVTVLFNGDVPKSRNRFFEVIDADAEAGIAGTLQVGDWMMQGIFIESDNSAFEYGYGEMRRNMTFLTDNPIWRRDVVKLFHGEQTRAAIINEGFRDASVTIEVFGAAASASVSIGGSIYEIDAAIPEGSRLVIDGLNKTAKIIAEDGTETNVLDKRVGEQVKGSGYYIFEQIPSGYSEVTWHPKSELRITVHELRLEVRLK